MALTATLYRFQIDLSDVDRGLYTNLDFRVAMHPSETSLFLLTRVLAYALNFQDGLDFNPGGLSDSDEPCLRVLSLNGTLKLWIEIGNPSAKKLHKASKAAQEVRVYTYKDPQLLLRDIASAHVHRAEHIGLFAFEPAFLERLAATLERDNKWGLIHTDGSLVIDVSGQTEQGELRQIRIS